MDIRVKRAYCAAEGSDGYRVLVDRLWPRGLTRETLRLDLWAKELAPTTGLRRWYAHDPARWADFTRRYASELEQQRDSVNDLLARAAAGPVTLIYAAKDEERNNAVALRTYLARHARGERT